MEELSAESETELDASYHHAVKEGLKPKPLRHLREAPDLWQDDFWNWFGSRRKEGPSLPRFAEHFLPVLGYHVLWKGLTGTVVAAREP